MTNFKKIKCLVIDDEPPARDILKKHIADVEALELAGDCCSAVEALTFLQHNRVELLFLDIQMPHLLGTSFIRTLKNPPKVIFTTAYRKFAIEGFELDAVDYLLKPISYAVFCLKKKKVLQTTFQAAPNSQQFDTHGFSNADNFIYFRTDRKMVKVFLDDILYVESLKDYIKVITTTK